MNHFQIANLIYTFYTFKHIISSNLKIWWNFFKKIWLVMNLLSAVALKRIPIAEKLLLLSFSSTNVSLHWKTITISDSVIIVIIMSFVSFRLLKFPLKWNCLRTELNSPQSPWQWKAHLSHRNYFLYGVDILIIYFFNYINNLLYILI